MGKLKKEDLPEILPVKRTRMTLQRVALERLEIGEGYFLPREEWKTKNTPYYIVSAIRKKNRPPV